MKFKDVLMDAGISEKRELLPSGFQRIGDIILLHLNEELMNCEKEIGTFVRKRFRATSVFIRGPVDGEFRTPSLRRIAGRANTTIHRENGCLFRIDVSRLMFAKGNIYERRRIQPHEGEHIVDMFAGIGYFSVQIAKRNPSCTVIAIEKNPVAVKFLRENIRLNRVKNVTVVNRDCRDAGINDSADRIIMGYFPGTERFLPTAFSFLRRAGTIHFHNAYRIGELWRKPLGTLQATALENGYRLEGITHKRIVKSLSPRTVHSVVDAHFSRF